VAETLALDGPLAARKVFSRRDVIVAVAPKLFGQESSELARTVDKVLADPEAIPLMATPLARERAYAAATVIAPEQAIAAAVDIEVTRTDAPAVDEIAARRAIAHRETELATHLTVGQRAAVLAVTTSGRGTELIVGLAGSGKTTALAAVRGAFEADGLEVRGTSTSGQAARTLKRQAGIEASRTLASLTWRLDHGQLELTPRHVVVVDEAAMSEGGPAAPAVGRIGGLGQGGAGRRPPPARRRRPWRRFRVPGCSLRRGSARAGRQRPPA
jgi:hypothetical protein